MNVRIIKKILKRTYLFNIYKQIKGLKNYKKSYEAEHKKVEFLIDHFDLKDMKPAKGFLRKRQRDLMTFTKEIFDELSGIEINPFLIGGNLIGWIRHNGFVPWDDDIDFGIFRTDFKKLLEYAKTNWMVLEYRDSDQNQMNWIEEVTKKSNGKYILFIYPEHIQVSKGTSCIDRISVDFFLYDFYDDFASFEVHNSYVIDLKKQLAKCKNCEERLALLRDSIKKENNTTINSKTIYFGNDSCEPFLRTFNTKWIDYNTVFPLQTIDYEGVELLIPNKAEEFIKFEYPNYLKLPTDFGNQTHNYWKEYKKRNLVTVEFYLIDSFEIFHFLPIYEFLRNKGVYAIFVAEPPEINVSCNWFNYEKAIKILNKLELEYDTICNPNANYAFTTQRSNCLKKYKNKKVNLVYGCSLYKNQFAFSEESIKGFDYKLLHGPFTLELCKRNLGKRFNKYKDIFVMVGYPKFTLKNIELLDEKLSDWIGRFTEKKTIGYLPTWGDHSCIGLFSQALKSLKKEYEIITKPHHCTARLEEESINRNLICEFSDLVLDSDFSTVNFLKICDLYIIDASSGVSLESAWLNNKAKILLISKDSIDDCYFQEMKSIAKVIDSPNELSSAIHELEIDDRYIMKRKEFVNSVFGEKEHDYLSEFYDSVFERG